MCVHLDPTGMAGAEFAPANDDTRRRLLVVNDDGAFVELAHTVGEGLGFLVRSSSQAGDFARLYEDFAPSIIIFDFFSAGMDGIEAVNWLRKQESSAYLLLTSAKKSFLLGLAKELARAKGFGSVDVVIEPASQPELSDLLTRRLIAIEFSKRSLRKPKTD